MTDTETPADEGWETHEWTCVGQRVYAGNKLYTDWIDHEGERRAYGKLSGRVGHVYLVEMKGSSARHNPRYLRESDDERVLQWGLEDRAARTEMEAARAEKRAPDALRARLAPLREQYKRTIGTARKAALLAAIIQEVTT